MKLFKFILSIAFLLQSNIFAAQKAEALTPEELNSRNKFLVKNWICFDFSNIQLVAGDIKVITEFKDYTDKKANSNEISRKIRTIKAKKNETKILLDIDDQKILKIIFSAVCTCDVSSFERGKIYCFKWNYNKQQIDVDIRDMKFDDLIGAVTYDSLNFKVF